MVTPPAGALDDAPLAADPSSETPPGAALAVVETAHNVAVGPLAPSDANPVDAYLTRLNTPASRETAIASLKRALVALGVPPERWRSIRWAALGPQKSRVLYRRVVDAHKPATARLTLSIVRGVLRQAKALGQLGADRFEAVVGDACWPQVKAKSPPAGRALTRDELRRLKDYCEGRPPLQGAMVWAILSCAVGAGLRRFELANLRGDALSDDAKHLYIVGKGGKEVVHPLPPAVGGALEAWIAQREEAGIVTDQMFVSLDAHTGAFRKPEINKFAVWRLIRSACRKSGCAPFTPHDLRRTYGSRLLNTHDAGRVQKLMRHEDVTTTFRYDRRPQEEVDEAAFGFDILEGL